VNLDLYADLAWLPAPPADFRAGARALVEANGEAHGAAVARLARHRLNENQLRVLAATIETLRSRGESLHPLVPFTLGIVGNATLEPLVPALIASGARHGIDLRCMAADFGQTMQAALLADSPINRSAPDAVLIALDVRGIGLSSRLGDERESAAAIAEGLQHVQTLCDGFAKNAKAVCFVQTLAPPAETVFGNLDAATAGTLRHACSTFNRALHERFAPTPHVVFDVAALAETVGLAAWHSPREWNMAKFAFAMRFLPLYADHVARTVAALRGKSRRCLILDLDDTLWGGVVGDAGSAGLLIGNGDPTGEAHLELQRAALRLRDRGILLAVASKNDDDVARSVFHDHPEMLVREHHLAAFQANWQDKATNIAAIAEALSLGLDAMVFLDDNPFERELVRTFLPDVAVPELPADPAFFARTLSAAGYFEMLTFSDEDRRRAAAYAENAQRAALAGETRSLDEYLASLDMEIAFAPFDLAGRSRIVQLINKTNQFNLTTKRYSEIEVTAFEGDPAGFTLQTRLIDRFGDNGMIGVVICRASSADTWEIDTWLMSCRVLGRGVEQAVLAEIVRAARTAGVRRLIGRYIPSGRNAMVSGHYRLLGFELVNEAGDGSSEWSRETSVDVAPAPMRVTRAAGAE
jgi:FkbH-like protein